MAEAMDFFEYVIVLLAWKARTEGTLPKKSKSYVSWFLRFATGWRLTLASHDGKKRPSI